MSLVMSPSVDLLVIGGGIVGAGVARDGALRGLSTVLVDRNDFAAGTSSNSSRLLHGGIRYLAQGRLGLVYEASREKLCLQRIAPHLVEPLAFVFPAGRSAGYAKWKLSLGVKLYDLLCHGRNFGASQILSVEALARRVPGLQTEGLGGAARYFDALTQDARLVIDTLRSAEAAGATLCNYTRFDSAELEGGEWQCQVTDMETSEPRILRTRAIVNAGGAWADQLSRSVVRLRPTKGVHLVVRRERLPVSDAVVMPEGRRILFAIPWGRRTILGTTDTDVADVNERLRCEPEDSEYILRVVNRWFPDANLDASDIVGTWSGLRPLVQDRRGNPSDISRAHHITMPMRGWWDVAGGKLTTYRLMAEQATDRVVDTLGLDAGPCRTAEEPLIASGNAEHSGILPPPVTEQVVRQICRSEWVRHLGDLLIRRTSWWYAEDDRPGLIQTVIPWIAETLQWSPGRSEEESGRMFS